MWKHVAQIILVTLMVASGNSQPLIPTPSNVTRPVTNGAIMLTWSYGSPWFNTLSNVTTRSSVDSGVFNTYLASGLAIGSTNVFVAANTAGLSNMATGVAQPFVLRASIKPYSYMVTVPTSTNTATRILTSTNLSVWTTFRIITNSGTSYQFVWTNDGGARFFHSVAP